MMSSPISSLEYSMEGGTGLAWGRGRNFFVVLGRDILAVVPRAGRDSGVVAIAGRIWAQHGLKEDPPTTDWRKGLPEGTERILHSALRTSPPHHYLTPH